MARPLVSYVIPVFNGAATIEETLSSLQAQSFGDWEAVVVNDGSTDEGPALVDRLSAGDQRIRQIHRDNGGRARARNTGLDAFQGHYAVLLDADDRMSPTGTTDLLEAAEASPHRAAAGQCELLGPENQPLGWDPSPWGLSEIGLDELLGFKGFQLNAQIIHRERLGATRKREDVPIYEDMDLFLRLGEQGQRWSFIEKPVACYRLHHNDRSFPGFFEYYRWYARLIRESFARARDLGWAQRGVDVSAEREDAAVREGSWQFAHLVIHQDETPGMDRLAAIVACTDRRAKPVDAEAAARSAHSHLPMAEEAGPGAWGTETDRYGALLRRWWGRCEREGWLAPAGAGACAARLAELLVRPENVARRMAEEARWGAEVLLLGLGRNGRRVARELLERGVRFRVRDDGLTHQQAREILPGDGFEWVDQRFQPRRGGLALVSPLDDAGFMRTMPAGLRVVRWREMLDAESRPMRRRLEGAA